MLSNYIKLALRNLAKNRLYAVINIGGLAIGLAIFLMGSILAGYERNHDSVFAKRDRIFTAGSVFAPEADIGVLETDGIYTAMTPLIKSEVSEIEAVARTVRQEYLVSIDNDSYYQSVNFADAEITQIFDFDYLHGDARAIESPTGVILSRSLAKKFFGRTDVLGETLSLDHKYDLLVSAVIEDIPADSHFNSSLISDRSVGMFVSLKALGVIDDYDEAGNWGNLSMGDMTYMLLPENKTRQWLHDEINAIFKRHAPEGQIEFIPELRVRPLVEVNTMIWDAMGIPALDSIRILGLMVLIIACVNYTNLATAQSFGRAREVGLRKTFGAKRRQLLVQFLVESVTTVILSMLLAVACLELLVPAFNQWSGKLVSLDYFAIAPFLLLTTVVVGLMAGAYPALLITRASPVDSLKNNMLKGAGGNIFRNIMIGTQFALSIFMLALVLVVYFQNKQVQQSSEIFPKENILVLDRVEVEQIRERHDTLRQQLMNLPGVENVTYTSQVPFEQSNSSTTVSLVKGDESAGITLAQISIDEGFLETFDIPLLQGRAVGREFANDLRAEESTQVNVLINQTGLGALGFDSAGAAMGQSYFNLPGEDSEEEATQFTIVGIVPDRNYMGLHNKIKPMMFYIEPEWNRQAAVRLKGEDLKQTLDQIESTWKRVNPDYPIQHRFLDEVFNEVYNIFKTMNKVLAGFAVVALSLALVGLFGLAAFMAERRTREIGIRKVLGARVDQIVRLLIWQFSIPVLWSLLIAMPGAYFVSGLYLDFFAERIGMLPLIILLASVMGIVTAWIIVAGHAIKVASASPIQSLRYE